MKTRTKKAIIWTAVAAGLAAGAIAVITRNNEPHELSFKLESVSRGDIESVVTATGSVKAMTQVEVGSQVSGVISRMAVDFNSEVKEGQVLAEIDPQPSRAKVAQSNANYLSARAALERAKVTLANLKSKYERSASLARAKLVSPEELEAAEASYLQAKSSLEDAKSGVDRARSALESSRLDLGYCTIRAPIDGIVISRNMEAGQTVQANFQAVKMFEIASDLAKMKVECDVDEADVGSLAEGQTARFTVDAFPEIPFSGTVQQVRYSPTTTSNVVTYTAVIDAANPELKLRPGMTATVTIVTGEAKGAILVPAAALRFTPTMPQGEAAKLAMKARDAAGKTPGARRQVVLWRLDDAGLPRAEAVGAGISSAFYVEILSGSLKEGAKVITGYETAEQAAAREREGPPPGAMLMGAPPPPPPPPPGGGGGPPPR